MSAADPTSRPVIAVDGPSGSGKSSVSRAVARAFGWRYLDTGSLYRALTWWLLERGVDVDDADAVAAAVDEPVDIVAGTDPDAPGITVDGLDVATAIREQRVTAAVSAVSAVPQVRQRLLRLQRDAIGNGGVVVEGRDIGTVVAPDALLKVFLTADAAVRAARRHAELPHHADVSAAEQDLARRDRTDSARAVSPLTAAADAVEVDATHLDLDGVVAVISDLVRQRIAEAS